MKKLLVLLLVAVTLLPLSARTDGQWTITSGFDVYGLVDDPVFLHSVPIGIAEENYFDGTPFGLISEMNFYVPLYYMYGNEVSPENTFRNAFYADYALYASARWALETVDLFCGLGWFASLRFLHFGESGGMQIMLNSGPRMKLGTDIHLCDFLSLRVAVNGSMYVLTEDYLMPERGNGLSALSVTPEIGLSIHFNDDWDFGRRFGR